MKKTSIWLLVAAISAASPATAEVFDPSEFGLVTTDEASGQFCHFVRNAVEGSKKVWACSDGTTRFHEENIWGSDGIAKTREKPKSDMSVSVEDGSLMTVTVMADRERCYRSGRRSHCERYLLPSVSYLMTDSKSQCEHLAPRLAARQYVMYRDLGVAVEITYGCEGMSEAEDSDSVPFMGMGIPMLGVTTGF